MRAPSWLLFIFWCCYDPRHQQSRGLANEQQLRFGSEEMLECFWNIERGPGPRNASFRKHNEKYCTSITSSQYTPCITLYTVHSMAPVLNGKLNNEMVIFNTSYLISIRNRAPEITGDYLTFSSFFSSAPPLGCQYHFFVENVSICNNKHWVTNSFSQWAFQSLKYIMRCY